MGMYSSQSTSVKGLIYIKLAVFVFFFSSLSVKSHARRYVARVTQCKYKRIGCPWQGPFHELPAHESECSHPTKTGTELMGILGEMDQSHRRDMQLYNSIFSLLCYEKIGFTGRYKKSLPYLY